MVPGMVSWLPLGLALLLAAPGSSGPDADAASGGPPTALRVEHFLFEEPDGVPAGFAVWRRRDGPRGLQLERELRFLDPARAGAEQGVFHVECLERTGARLVQREIGPGGRALLAEWLPPDGALRAFEWGGCGARREVLATDRGATVPLYLVELLRDGSLAAGRLRCFDPLAREVVELDVRTVFEPRADVGAGPPVRAVEMRRLDGTLFLRLWFQGTDLSAFQLQDGGSRARRIPADEYERRRGSREPRPGSSG